MNIKKILAGVLSTAMLLSITSAVMAEDTDVMPIGNAEIEEINNAENMGVYADVYAYDKTILRGQVKEVEEGQIIISEGEDRELAINVDDSTVFINEKGETAAAADIKADDFIMVVASNMQTRSIPPQSYGYLIAKADGDSLPTFIEIADINSDEEGNLVLSGKGGEYEVVVSKETDTNGIKDFVVGNQLLAYSKVMTMSIPAIVPAEKLVHLPNGTVPALEIEEGEKAEELTVFDKVIVNGEAVEVKVEKSGDALLLPVRAVSEAMGLEVAWDGTLKAVTVGTVPMGVNFNIGENKYNKARMTPFTLSSAPELIGDTTYVPAEFFAELLEAEITVSEGAMSINL